MVPSGHHLCSHAASHIASLSLCLHSDETEDEIVSPSPSPSPEWRSRSRSSAQPESGIKRLYVVQMPAHTLRRLSYSLVLKHLHVVLKLVHKEKTSK